MKSFALVIIAILLAIPALASCLPTSEETVTVTLDSPLQPLSQMQEIQIRYPDNRLEFKQEYSPYSGCFMVAGGKVLGIAGDGKLCQIPPGTEVTLHLTPATCCDTRPNYNTICNIVFKPEDSDHPTHAPSRRVFLVEK